MRAPWISATLLWMPLTVPALQAPKPPTAAAAGTPGAAVTAPAQTPAAPSAPVDPVLVAGQNLVGRALILRGFPAAANLAYDASGKVEGSPKTTDWTLAGLNVQKAMHPSPETLELEGVRVAIRYNPDAHEFQRHPMNDEKMKLLLRVPPGATARQMEALLRAIFSIGIDPALQRSMPALWQHYFDPGTPWPAGEIGSQTVYPLYGLPDQPKDVAPPILAHKVDASITDAALHDKVTGTVQLRMVVDAAGVPQRISVTRPLGYGLDERAAEAMAKWRFNPATRGGKPVPSGILVNLDFLNAPPGPH